MSFKATFHTDLNPKAIENEEFPDLIAAVDWVYKKIEGGPQNKCQGGVITPDGLKIRYFNCHGEAVRL